MARLLLLGSRPRRPRHRSTPLLLLLILLGLVAATTTALGAQAAAEPSMVPAINGTMLVFPTGEGADGEVLIVAAPAAAGGEGHAQRLRRAQDAGCVISYTVYTAAFQAQEVAAQIVWQFVTTLGESEPVQGGYRVWVGGETYSRDLRVSLCGQFTAVKARLTRSTLRLNIGSVQISTGRFADSDRYASPRGKNYIIRSNGITEIPLEEVNS